DGGMRRKNIIAELQVFHPPKGLDSIPKPLYLKAKEPVIALVGNTFTGSTCASRMEGNSCPPFSCLREKNIYNLNSFPNSWGIFLFLTIEVVYEALGSSLSGVDLFACTGGTRCGFPYSRF
ncbi:MAG TPA: hypothetical protein PLU04_13820, partial [Anaerolineaceae bacterium]|nr:hypothetical protein [Anaerolineaceae bacterium]